MLFQGLIEIILTLETRESVRVDLPLSTLAITDMFLMFSFLSMHSRTSSVVKLTCKMKRSWKPEKKA